MKERKMRKNDSHDVEMSIVAVVADAVTFFGALMLATFLRFDSGLFDKGVFALKHGRSDDLYLIYSFSSGVASLLLLYVYQRLELYVRPQLGSFGDKIPRLVRATGMGFVLCTVVAFPFKNSQYSVSTGVLMLAFVVVCLCVIVERLLLFRLELFLARKSSSTNKVLVLGTDSVAGHLKTSILLEPRLRSEIAGYLRTDMSEPDVDVPVDQILGTIGDLPSLLQKENKPDMVVLTDSRLPHEQITDIIVQCERSLVSFKMVPDLFRILTWGVCIETIGDLPLMGMRGWPLDGFWSRFFKRMEDIVGAALGLVISAPVLLGAAIAVKLSSPGPVFYRQERCGLGGRGFALYKFRTMRTDAEADSGPVWATENDPRRTSAGAVLRSFNIDELPQLWNVLKGDMSLVGPRPERPHFVEQFKTGIGKYMLRHISKPGITGWAQVNGLRGNTSIEDRIKYDLYYLENWSVAFDFKILIRTIFARHNAY